MSARLPTPWSGGGALLGAALLAWLSPPLASGSPAAVPGAPSDSASAWVLFHASAARADHLPPALSDEALALRRARGIALSSEDRPLPQALVERVRATGADVRVESRWLRGVSVRADAAALQRLTRMPEVRAVLPVAVAGATRRDDPYAPPPGSPPFTSARRRVSPFRVTPDAAASPPLEDYGLSFVPMAQLGVPAAHDLGFSGAGIRIAILDTGFEPGHETLAPLTLVAARDFIGRDGEVRSEGAESPDAERHGTWIWSLAGAAAPGRMLGPAFGAEWVLAKVDNALADPRADEDRWIAALEWADSMAVRVVISAVSFRRFDDGFEYPFNALTGDAALMTQAVDRAAQRGMLVVNEVGDGGPGGGTLAVPADADSVLSVGAVDSLGQPLAFSGRGPTADGRVKPELVARGDDLWAASSDVPTGYDRLTLGSTGFAAAQIGGAAALVWEAWPQFGPMAVREALLRSAGRARAPDNDVGHGVPDVGAAILFPRGFDATGVDGVRGDGTLTTLAPRFHWAAPLEHPLAGQVTYVLELSPDSTFERILFSRAVVEASSTRLTDPFRPGTRFFWRVEANTVWGISTVSATGGPIVVPSWATLRSPNSSSGSQIGTVRPRLVWSAIDAPAPLGPLEFDVEIFSNRTGELVQRIEGVRDTSVVVPEPLTYNDAFTWRLIVRSRRVGVADTVRSVGPFVIVSDDAPPATLLYQNFPNPFGAGGADSTRLWFDLRVPATVELTVHDLRGRLVRRLIPAPGCAPVELPPGLYGRAGLGGPDPCARTTWDGTDDAGSPAPGGVYLLRMRTEEGTQLRRMLLIRP